jgi:hypothetical protein
MGKGNHGESCAEAIRSVLRPSEVVAFSELFRRVKQRGAWKPESIWQDKMASIANLPPARFHWKSSKPFLFIHGDERYELYDPRKHPKVVE